MTGGLRAHLGGFTSGLAGALGSIHELGHDPQFPPRDLAQQVWRRAPPVGDGGPIQLAPRQEAVDLSTDLDVALQAVGPESFPSVSAAGRLLRRSNAVNSANNLARGQRSIMGGSVTGSTIA